MDSLDKPKILIVDDMELNRQILSVILQDSYSILEAANGVEALVQLKRERKNISLIMLDIVMPVMDGFQLLERIKGDAQLKEIPIIFVTAETYRENITKGVEEGVCDVIAKPFDPYLVHARVDHLIQLTESRENTRQTAEVPEAPTENTEKPPEIALIVDDVAINRELLKSALEKEYKILEAENGQVALELLKENKGNIAVVLLDIIMPVMDGTEMMIKARLKGLLHRVPVIAITAEDSPIKMKRLRELGICEIIPKPFDSRIVMNRISNMIELFASKRNAEKK